MPKHQLFVHVGGRTPGEREKSKALTRSVLRYVQKHLPAFKQMGVSVHITKLTDGALEDPGVVRKLGRALESDEPVSFPALRTPARPYFGLKEIVRLYERNLDEFSEFQRKGTRGGGAPDADADDDDELAQFYRREMTEEKALADRDGDGDDDITESQDLMEAYRARMKERAGGPRGKAKAPAKKRPPPAAAKTSPSRPDNLVPGRGGGRPLDDPLSSLQALGPDTAGDGAADDFMLKSFLENMEEST